MSRRKSPLIPGPRRSRGRSTTPGPRRARASSPGSLGRRETTAGRVGDRIRVPSVDARIESSQQVMKRARGRAWLLAGVFGVALAGVGVRAASRHAAATVHTLSLYI